MTTDTAVLPTTVLVTTPSAPLWPQVIFDGAEWFATYAGKNCGEHQVTLRRGDRQPLTVPAASCQFRVTP